MYVYNRYKGLCISFTEWMKYQITQAEIIRNHGHGRGSAPYGHSDSTSRLWAVAKSDCLKQRASVQLSLSSCSRNSLSNARKDDPDGPLDSRLKTGWDKLGESKTL